MGAEDFPFFIEGYSGVYFRLGIQDEDKVHPIHIIALMLMKKYLRVGMKVFSQAVIDILEGGAEPWESNLNPGTCRSTQEAVRMAMAKPIVNPDLDPQFFDFYRQLCAKLQKVSIRKKMFWC
jgi:hypothetical protein